MSPADQPDPPSDSPLDPRIHPYRDDIAADFLEGRVDAKTFAAGKPCRAGSAFVPVMTKPDKAELQSSELLFGEAFTVYEEKDGWSWGQCGHDGYVGYAPTADIFGTLPEPTHWLTAVRSLVFPDPKGEYPATMCLNMTARVAIEEEDGDYVKLASGGWMFGNHLAPIGETRPDFVATAAIFSRVPYLWGGRGGQGIDCSGLVQVALAAAGIDCPRDSDQQADSIGLDVPVPDDQALLEAGDIVFFPGHVGFYLGSGALLHATSHDMMVATHSLVDVLARVQMRHGKGITRVRRVKTEK